MIQTSKKSFNKGDLVVYYPITYYFETALNKKYAIILVVRSLLQTVDMYTFEDKMILRNISFGWITKVES